MPSIRVTCQLIWKCLTFDISLPPSAGSVAHSHSFETDCISGGFSFKVSFAIKSLHRPGQTGAAVSCSQSCSPRNHVDGSAAGKGAC